MPQGYFTVSEMLRILLHRYHLLPVGFFGDHNFYEVSQHLPGSMCGAAAITL